MVSRKLRNKTRRLRGGGGCGAFGCIPNTKSVAPNVIDPVLNLRVPGLKQNVAKTARNEAKTLRNQQKAAAKATRNKERATAKAARNQERDTRNKERAVRNQERATSRAARNAESVARKQQLESLQKQAVIDAKKYANKIENSDRAELKKLGTLTAEQIEIMSSTIKDLAYLHYMNSFALELNNDLMTRNPILLENFEVEPITLIHDPKILNSISKANSE